MAIKDLNQLNNKQRGQKLYASDWNKIVDAIIEHIDTSEIHQKLSVSRQENSDDLLIFNDGTKNYTYVLKEKTGITYGDLQIYQVLKGAEQIVSQDNTNYNIDEISGNGESIILKISFKRDELEDNTPTGNTDYPNVNVSVVTEYTNLDSEHITITDIENEPQSKLVTISVPPSEDFDNITTYDVRLIGKIHDSAQSDPHSEKTINFNLTQNTGTKTYSNPTITLFTLLEDDENTTALDSNRKILSAGGKLVYSIQYEQQYGSDTITTGLISNNITLTAASKFSIFSYDDSTKKLILSVNKNIEESDDNLSFAIKINLPHNNIDYESDLTEQETFIQNGKITTIGYSEPTVIELKYNKIPQTGTTSSGIKPSSYKFSLKETTSYDNGESSTNTTKMYTNTSTNIPSSVTLLFIEYSNDYKGTSPFNQDDGTIIKTTANTATTDLDVAKVDLKVTLNGGVSDQGGACTVQQTAAPSAYYRFVNTNVTPNEYTNPVPLTSGEKSITITSENNNKDIIFLSTSDQFSNYQKYYSDGTNNYPVVLNPGDQFAVYCNLTHNYTDDDATINNITFYGCAAVRVSTGDIVKVKII